MRPDPDEAQGGGGASARVGATAAAGAASVATWLTTAAWSGAVLGGAAGAGAAWTEASICPTAWPPLHGRPPGVSADAGGELTALRRVTQGRSEYNVAPQCDNVNAPSILQSFL